MQPLIGFNRDCNRGILGVYRIIFTNSQQVLGLNFDQLDRITDISMIPDGVWYEIQFDPGDATFEQDQVREGAWLKTTQKIEFSQPDVYSGVLRAVRRLGDSVQLHAIVVTMDDRAYYAGINFWPERGYAWETTNLEMISGRASMGNIDLPSFMEVSLEAKGRNYAPQVIYDLDLLAIDPLPSGDPEPDSVPPFVIHEYPADNSINVPVGVGFLRLFFNESIKWDGTPGVITLVRTGVGAVASWTFGVSAGLQIDPVAQTLTISVGVPTLVHGADYHVTITSGIEDLSGNDWPGISNTSGWNFTAETLPDTTEIDFVSFTPSDDSTTVDPTSTTQMVIEYDGDAAAGSGNILLYETTGDVLVGVYDVNGTDVSFSGTDVTITLGFTLSSLKDYYVKITSGAIISDASGISHAGISDETTWNFTTVDLGPPSYVSFSPAVNSIDQSYDPSSISFTASENLQKGTGTIAIKLFSDDSTLISFDVTDPEVSISGSIITLDLTGEDNLPPYDQIYITQPAGAFEDLSGNNLPSLTKAGSDVWKYSTGLPPLAATIVPVAGSGAQTITMYLRNANVKGVAVVEWEPGTFDRYEIAASPTASAVSNTFGSETSDNINVYFMGQTEDVTELYGIDEFQLLSQTLIQGVIFPTGIDLGFVQISNCSALSFLTNIDTCNILDGLTLATLGAFTGKTVDFVTGGGIVAKACFLSFLSGMTFIFNNSVGNEWIEFSVQDCELMEVNIDSVIWRTGISVSVNYSNSTTAADGVVINKFVNSLWTSLNLNGAGSAGGTLTFTAQQIDYFTGTGAAMAWASMWNILNIPASVSSWSLDFDDSQGPMSVVNTSDTSVDQVIEASGVAVGVMIGSEGGIYSIHDYTASGTSRVTLSQTGLSGSAKNVWMAIYFQDGFDMSSEITNTVPMVMDGTQDYRIQANAFPVGRIIMDLGDGSVILQDTNLLNPSSKSRTITPTSGNFSGKIYTEVALDLFRERTNSIESINFSDCGSDLISIRLGSSFLESLNIPQVVLDSLTDFRIEGSHADFDESFDLSSNTAIQILNIANLTGIISLGVATTSGDYPNISQLTLNNSDFAPMDLNGFDKANSISLTKMRSTGADHVFPASMENVENITQTNSNSDISGYVLDLDNFPSLMNLFWTGGDITSFGFNTTPHGNIKKFQIAPITTWSQSNTIDFSDESQIETIVINGTGSIGPIIGPSIGNGSNLIQINIPNLMAASDLDDLISDIYDIRAEAAGVKSMNILEGSGEISADSIAKINGTGSYLGDGLVDNGWSVTY